MGSSSSPSATSSQTTATTAMTSYYNSFVYKHQSWLPTIGVIFLTINSITAVYSSINNPWTVVFVVAAYVNVILLLLSIRIMERSPEGKQDGMKATVWALASTLTVMFSYRVAIMMPLILAVIVWIMAAVTVFGGFYALVLHRDEPDLFKADDKDFINPGKQNLL